MGRRGWRVALGCCLFFLGCVLKQDWWERLFPEQRVIVTRDRLAAEIWSLLGEQRQLLGWLGERAGQMAETMKMCDVYLKHHQGFNPSRFTKVITGKTKIANDAKPDDLVSSIPRTHVLEGEN